MLALAPMARGKLCVMGRSSKGREYYSRQTWRGGRNVTEYVPADRVEALRAATENYRRASSLFEEFVSLAEKESGF